MGLNSPTLGFHEDGLASALFTRTQQRVLAILFSQPERTFQRAEILRLAGGGTGAIHRELERLVASGLVHVFAVGNQKHYRVNRESPIFPELHGLILKTVGLAGPIKAALSTLGEKIQRAFIYGSVAHGRDTAASDIDLIVLADDLGYGELLANLHQAELQVHRKINPTLMQPAEWSQKLARSNGFVTKVESLPKIPLVGKH